MTTQRRRQPLERPRVRPCALVDRYWALKIARAAYRLTGTQLRVYSLMLELDRADRDRAGIGGCFLGEVEFARQCGRSVDVVTDARAELVRYHLVERVQLPGARQAFWFARLPPGVDDHVPVDVQAMRKGRQKDDAVRAWLRYQGDCLDRYIAAADEEQNHPVTGGDITPPFLRKGGDLTDDEVQRHPPSENTKAVSAASSDSLRTSDSKSDSLPTLPLSDSTDGAPSKVSGAGTVRSQRSPADRQHDLTSDPKLQELMRRWEAKRTHAADEQDTAGRS